MNLVVSVVIPAFNEELRLRRTLRPLRSYLRRMFGVNYEVIVVDDGSSDGTTAFLEKEVCAWPRFGWCRHARNRGKGAAIRTGILASHGAIILIADADGATPIEEERRLRDALGAGAHVAIGCRFARDEPDAVRRVWQRQAAGRLFAALTRLMFQLPLADTQCGFKMLGRQVAMELLPYCHETGYLFELELLLWARELGYRIAEAPVRWQDMPGSKVRLLRDGWRMLLGLARLRRALRARLTALQVRQGLSTSKGMAGRLRGQVL